MNRVAIVAGLVLLSIGGATPAWAEPSASVRVRPDGFAVGLAGWPPGTVTIALCTERPGGDCAFAHGVQTGVDAEGNASATLPAAAPATGCPCVVRVRTLTGALSRDTPVPLDAAAAPASAQPDVPRPLVITGVEVHSGFEWAGFFGGPVHRELVVTVRSDAPVMVTGSTVSVTAGRGEHPTGLVTAPVFLPLKPGDVRVYRIPVTFEAPAAGTYTVHGEIDPFGPLGPAGATVAFQAETTAQPWGLTAAAGLLLMCAAALRRYRRWSSRRAAAGSPAHRAPGRCG
ncbi:hypothetical protein [Dactylosporangium sp. CS-033363]|uniref:hypothetical protein n=1 Tax=Dactylosporangium sp. CS-033363 TaxID=3239935 RepID=UPI003D8C988B